MGEMATGADLPGQDDSDRRFLDRIFSRARRDESTGCLIWQGGLSRGAPALSACGRMVMVRSWLWLNAGNRLPEGRKRVALRAVCGNQRCIELQHAAPADMAGFGRHGGLVAVKKAGGREEFALKLIAARNGKTSHRTVERHGKRCLFVRTTDTPEGALEAAIKNDCSEPGPAGALYRVVRGDREYLLDAHELMRLVEATRSHAEYEVHAALIGPSAAALRA